MIQPEHHLRRCHGGRPRDVAEVKLHQDAALARTETVDAQPHGAGGPSVHRSVRVDFDVFHHRQLARVVKDRSSRQVQRVVPVAVIAALIFRNAILVDGGPLADAVALVGSDTPVDPEISLGKVG